MAFFSDRAKLFFFIFFFFFNDTATTEIYTLSLHDALPIYARRLRFVFFYQGGQDLFGFLRSEEHTSELQSRLHLVCRLLLEKKKKKIHKALTEDTTNTPPLSELFSPCT